MFFKGKTITEFTFTCDEDMRRLKYQLEADNLIKENERNNFLKDFFTLFFILTIIISLGVGVHAYVTNQGNFREAIVTVLLNNIVTFLTAIAVYLGFYKKTEDKT